MGRTALARGPRHRRRPPAPAWDCAASVRAEFYPAPSDLPYLRGSFDSCRHGFRSRMSGWRNGKRSCAGTCRCRGTDGAPRRCRSFASPHCFLFSWHKPLIARRLCYRKQPSSILSVRYPGQAQRPELLACHADHPRSRVWLHTGAFLAPHLSNGACKMYNRN